MKKRLMVVIFLVSASVVFAAKSYDSKKTNPDLKNIKLGYMIKELRTEVPEAWASSYLSTDNSGKYAPDKITDYGPDSDDGPGQALISTAWVPGNGDGIGEVVIVNTSIPQNFKIWNGFGKSKALYLANNRPKEVTFYLLIAESADETKTGYLYKNLKVRAEAKRTLADKFEYQYINLKEFQIILDKEQEKDNTMAIYSLLGIKINSVYKGTKFNDTCISDIGNTN
jgi:hypothetical protein